jgi:putative sigma-54 modulation protein
MQVFFTLRQFDASDDLKALIESKLAKRIEKLVHDETSEVRVTLATEKAWTIVDFQVNAWGEAFKCVEKTTTDLYPTIDLVIDKLERQLLKRKEMAKDRRVRREA